LILSPLLAGKDKKMVLGRVEKNRLPMAMLGEKMGRNCSWHLTKNEKKRRNRRRSNPHGSLEAMD
jgi:hypothetical protein